MKKILCALFMLGLSYFAVAQKISGKVLVNSDCASGGIDYYFFEDNTVIGICKGCEEVPLVQWGNWKQDSKNVYVMLIKQWEGIGVGAPVGPCAAVCSYEKYKAVYKNINKAIEYSIGIFDDDYVTEDCSVIKSSNISKTDVYKYLRTNFKGKYPESSEKLLTETELKNIPKKQLKIMRNEIFARYGYIFKTEEMSTYFKKQENYLPVMEDVDAFLSEIEVKNIALIKRLEK
jgi:hypothetical protein